MPKRVTSSELPTKLSDQLDEMTGSPTPSEGEQAPEGPVYQVIGDSKIPVSKAHGKLWKQRRDDGNKHLKKVSDAWQEALDYYSLTQDANRAAGDGSRSGSNAVRKKNNDILTERENLVFANMAAMVPALYAKAPDITATALAPEYEPIGLVAQHLANAILYRKTSPGVNLKPKVRKGIVQALLMNEAWAQIGYVFKQDTSDKAMADLQDAASRLAKAKNTKEIKQIEGELMALESKVSVLMPGGPFVKLRRGNTVLVDRTALEDDASDAMWIMYYDFLPTQYVQAVYGKRNSEGEYESIYQPTHIITSKSDSQSIDDQVNNFTAITGLNQDDRDQEMKALTDMTKVWYVEDKTTRRIYMYHDENWTWPIWVWDDPYHLDSFFTLKRLAFHTHPTETRAKGEVSYYLDQVDSISEINDAEARARQKVKRSVIYDTRAIKDQNQLDKYLRGDDGTALGVTPPEGMNLSDVMDTPIPDVVKYAPLFNMEAIQKRLASIDRISSVSDVQRGAQFKTNTTNKAIEAYSSVSNQRIDDRIDQIEDWIGDIAWAILQMCFQFMTAEEVTALIGAQRAQGWKQMTPEEIRQVFSCRVEGGSTVKPTSRAKKQEAMEVGQVLGQFAQAAPGPTLKIMLRMYERAFDEMVINDQDWKEIDAAIQAQQQQEQAPPPGEGDAGGQGGGQIPPEIQQLVAKLPQPAQNAIMKAIQQGVPPEQAIKEVTAALQQQGNG